MTSRTRDGESVGRVLRLLKDNKLFHIEAAIARVRRVKQTEGKSKLLEKSSSARDVDAQERSNKVSINEGLLSDHTRVTRLQGALNTIVKAYDDAVEQDTHFHYNLVYAVAGAAMNQSMRECVASRTNCFIWGPNAEKYHVLLDWMVDYERKKEEETLVSCDYVRRLLLDGIQSTAEKQNQFASCLTLFELLQRRRRRFKVQGSQRDSVCLLGSRVDAYIDALRGIIDRGTFLIADSHRVKPSKLALIALEALGLLCGDVAMQHLTFCEVAETKFRVTNSLMRKVVENMGFFLDMLRKWHSHSKRRQFLSFAIQHLQSYVLTCNIVLPRVNEVDDDSTNAHSRVIVDLVCWHWVKTVPILCTRTHIYSRKQKIRPSKLLAQVLEMCTLSLINSEEQNGDNNARVNSEIIYAQVRYICVLLDTVGGVQGYFKAFESFPVGIKAKIVFCFVQSLATATKYGNSAATRMSVNVLRSLLLPSDPLNLLSSQDEEQGLLSQLLRLNSNMLLTRGDSLDELEAQINLELLIADFIISRGLFITELLKELYENRKARLMSVLSLVRTFLYQLDRSGAQALLYRHWRKQLTQGVSGLITYENVSIRRLALSCLPSLDAVYCIAALTAIGMYGAENHAISSALKYLLQVSTRSSFEAIVTWFIDACQYGSISVHSPYREAPASPHDWSDFAVKLGESNHDKQEKVQGKLVSFCFGSTGWIRHVKSADARHIVWFVLMRKFFGNPRDAVLLRMLRELTVCGWVDYEQFNIMTAQICSRMMNATRLSEEFLDSDAPLTSNAVKDLLFFRLAPLLVLRMLPRKHFKANCLKEIPCGRKDLDHLNEYIDRQLKLNRCHSEAISGTTSEILFHILARSIVDPLEFKEVKVLATECLSAFPYSLVLPFVLAYIVAFLQEAIPHGIHDSSLIVQGHSVPNSCGLVTVKLMVYYLNRVFSEDDELYADCDVSSKAIALFVQILAISSDDLLLIDLQRGCIDCMALILSRLAASNCQDLQKESSPASASAFMDLLISWIFGKQIGCLKATDADTINARVTTLLEKMWSEARRDQLPLQVRIHCCDVLVRWV